ncbi:MAG: hypothetical protein ONB31_14755 [candidate division KSB1 bacterium]|nr:hypothetical protein [candidate division KSB1 bacterium]MDZ7357798.1 hypothetical protein [candidate division KSB1 bacterium]MDZ7398726.1 hypothetical protein [candidate division KSB1 bacterium]
MKMVIRTQQIIKIFGVILVFYPVFLLAQSTRLNPQFLRDIELCASVLDRMISPDGERSVLFGRSDTKGYYFSNYGVIFNVNYSLSGPGEVFPEMELLHELKDDADFDFDFKTKQENANRELEAGLEKLRAKIIKFLSAWTAALIENKSDEKITVIVDIDRPFLMWPGMADQRIQRLIATATMNDIRAFQKESINEEEFARRVKFERIGSSDEELAILSNVIETALSHENQVSPNVMGYYLKGYGAIFFADIPYGMISYKNLADRYQRLAEIYAKRAKRQIPLPVQKTDDQEPDKIVEKIEQKIINILSNYAYSLKQLKPDESVEIMLSYRGNPIKGQYSKSIIKVQKEAINLYNREKINFDEFKKRVSISYY